MIENIVIRKAVTEEERSLFWERLRAYFCRDIFPDPEDEDRPYFLGDDYRRTMESLRTRPVHPVHWLVFSRNGQDVGFALAAVFTGEDGKCFILEFCVLPEHRGGGMGTACVRTLLNWAREQGAGYAELNCTTPTRQRFWGRLGFVANGADEWGVPLMLLPPELLDEMLRGHPVGGPIPGRLWVSPGYGLGVMTGGIANGAIVAGHTGGGPGSAIAVYQSVMPATRRTIAAFATSQSEAAVEERCLR